MNAGDPPGAVVSPEDELGPAPVEARSVGQAPLEEVARGVYLVRDTCNVYLIVSTTSPAASAPRSPSTSAQAPCWATSPGSASTGSPTC
jgi:hypothetical protein